MNTYNTLAALYESPDLKNALLVINSQKKLTVADVETMLRKVQINGIISSKEDKRSHAYKVSQKAIEVIDVIESGKDWKQVSLECTVTATPRLGLLGQVIVVYTKAPPEYKMKYWTVLIINDGGPLTEGGIQEENIRIVTETIY
jgi:hypothetical protein